MELVVVIIVVSVLNPNLDMALCSFRLQKTPVRGCVSFDALDYATYGEYVENEKGMIVI